MASEWDALQTALAGQGAARPKVLPGTREAAVSLVLRPGDETELLLVRRAERTGDPWSGHMAFPGGTRRPEDADLIATAFRETEEEAGVPLHSIGTLLGALDPVAPATPRLPPILIAPFVVAVPSGTPAIADQNEIVAAHWIPLAFLRDERNADELLLDMDDVRRSFPSVRYGEHLIWGLTHRIMQQFFDVAGRAGW